MLTDPVWETFKDRIKDMAKGLRREEKPKAATSPEPDRVYSVPHCDEYYPVCPRCGEDFDDSNLSLGVVYRCRRCDAQITVEQP